MTYEQWLRHAGQQLTKAGIGTARLDALVLLEDETGRDRAWLLAHHDFELSALQLDKLENLLSRRTRHEPLAYLRGRTEFYGREFLLTTDVLEPRPESETMIDLLKRLAASYPELSGRPARRAGSGPKTPFAQSSERTRSSSSDHYLSIADVGAGSGALGITAQLELPDCRMELLEIDSAACKVAKMNVDKFTLDISVIKSDLLADAATNFDILLCNLPYVPDDFKINTAAMNEPRLAIFGGPDGLDVYRKLFKQLQKRPHKPLYILSECLPPQHEKLQQIAETASYRLTETDDFIQAYRRA